MSSIGPLIAPVHIRRAAELRLTNRHTTAECLARAAACTNTEAAHFLYRHGYTRETWNFGRGARCLALLMLAEAIEAEGQPRPSSAA